MKTWTVERKLTFCLTAVFILLGILNLVSFLFTFRFSRSMSFSLLDMTLFFSVAAFIVVRRLSKVLLSAKTTQLQLIRSIEQVAESIVIADLTGSILYVNPAFERISGYTRAEAIGSNPRIQKSGRHLASFYQAMWPTLKRGETWSGELINRRKDGTLYNEVATISPIRDQGGKISNFVAVKRDVTHEILLRDRLNQSQKMEAVGRLAGGIAHDFNNLLMVIRTYTDMLQERLPINDSRRRNTEQIMKAVERGSGLTGQMLAYSRNQIISPVVFGINALIDEIAKLLKRVIGEDIEIQLVLPRSEERRV